MKKTAIGVLVLVFAVSMVLPGVPSSAFASAQSGIAAADGAVASTNGHQLSATRQAELGVQADSGRDILLGVFTRGLNNWTNDVYASLNGKTFYNVASMFESKRDQPYYEGHYAQQCPSIIYHNGYFWSLSNWNRNDGKFWPLISYSKDLVHWTHPEGDEWIQGTHGVTLDRLPTVDGGDMFAFDVVAPEWSKAPNGDIYIVFSAGYYGEYHGEPTFDKMQAYTVKVKELSAIDGEPDGETGYFWPRSLVFKAGVAKKLGFSDYDNANFIDGQIFVDKGKAYLVIKKDGLTNQLYATQNIRNPNKWKLVNPEMTWGYEAASLAKLNKKYLLFTDGVLGTKSLGVRLVTSKKLLKSDSWGEPGRVLYLSQDFACNMKTRHGTVITLKTGTEGWRVAKRLLNKQRHLAKGSVYRLYRKKRKEYFYTTNATEAGKAVQAGWKYKGVSWHVPAKSKKPVYRLFNGTIHAYTSNKAERKRLKKKGWKYEGIAWYSVTNGGIPVYRLYKPGVKKYTKVRVKKKGRKTIYVKKKYTKKYVKRYHYTTSRDEKKRLLSKGWKSKGVGWYVAKE